ncbi:general transcription factor II-I repeat domain-containing protein 2-like [Hypanus sabinus]|uniref:general transcription factor II-I repeat domain-containing protein 2-like n=1 Tax=Hypanus sabinus TaxID=79690 RepID=UPI0028C4F69F|nr:general transcription factor II-I repeat domain-containing protein 2-like [Hypanus sabinus]
MEKGGGAREEEAAALGCAAGRLSASLTPLRRTASGSASRPRSPSRLRRRARLTLRGLTAVCLICQETVAVFKEYNISRHFATKHANYASDQSTKEREANAQRLAANLQAQQNFLHHQTAIHDSSTKASFMLSFKLAKASKPLSEGEFLKECMVETAGVLCPESKDKFEKISLSCRTVTRCVELIDEDITSDLNKKAESFTLYSLALDESNDVKDTAQLLIFIRGINNTFEITEEFLTMESLKGKTRGEDLYDRVSAVIENMKLPWSKLINVTTDGSPNLTGKNVGLLRRIQNKMKDENPDQDVIFLHCIIHQESLCKSVLQLNHVVNPVIKLVNFIRARGLQHRQFIMFLEETDADHQDLLYHSRVRWLSLGKVFQRVWELKEEIGAFLELLRKAGEFPELSNKSWLCDFAFAVDIFSHMNELNVKLQGKDQFVHDMYTNVKAFKSKLAFFSRQISNKLFTHFPTLATLEEAGANLVCCDFWGSTGIGTWTPTVHKYIDDLDEGTKYIISTFADCATPSENVSHIKNTKGLQGNTDKRT